MPENISRRQEENLPRPEDELVKTPQRTQEELEAALNHAQESTQNYEKGRVKKDLNENVGKLVEEIKKPENWSNEPIKEEGKTGQVGAEVFDNKPESSSIEKTVSETVNGAKEDFAKRPGISVEELEERQTGRGAAPEKVLEENANKAANEMLGEKAEKKEEHISISEYVNLLQMRRSARKNLREISDFEAKGGVRAEGSISKEYFEQQIKYCDEGLKGVESDEALNKKYLEDARELYSDSNDLAWLEEAEGKDTKSKNPDPGPVAPEKVKASVDATDKVLEENAKKKEAEEAAKEKPANGKKGKTKEKAESSAPEEPEKDVEAEMRKEMRRDVEERIVGKYEKGAMLSNEVKNIINNTIELEIEDAYKRFVPKWLKNNDLRKEGIDVNGLDDKAQFESIWKNETMRSRALHDMENDDRYKKDFETQNKGLDLLKDLKKDQIPLETHYLLINNLNKETQILKREMDDLPEGSAERNKIQGYVDNITKAQKELVEKITGKNLDKQADEELKASGDPRLLMIKEDYVKSILDANFDSQSSAYINGDRMSEKYGDVILKSGLSSKQIEELNKNGSINISTWPKNIELSKEDIAAAVVMGINVNSIKGKGWFPWSSKKIMAGGRIIAEDINELDKKLKEGWEGNIKSTIRAGMTAAAEENYKQGKVEYESKKEEIIQREIDKLASSSQNAEGGVAGVYERIKQRLVAEFLEGAEKKERGPQEIKAIEKTFSKKKGERIDSLNSFIQEAYYRSSKELQGLKGNLKSDAKNLSRFLGDYGVDVSAADFRRVVNAEDYKTAVSQKRGFINFLLGLINSEPWAKKSKNKKAA